MSETSNLEKAEKDLLDQASKADAQNFVQTNIIIALARNGTPQQQEAVQKTLDMMGKHATDAGADVGHSVASAEFFKKMIFN